VRRGGDDDRSGAFKGETVIKTRVHSIVRRIVLAGAIATLAGCVVYEPYPYGYGQPVASAYDRAWNAALGAVRDQGVQVSNEDRSAGVIDGRRGGVTVKTRLVTQADGRVRIEFNVGGNLAEDPGLSDRISRSYEARMGRRARMARQPPPGEA
jgi:hypothetical protein